MQSTSTRSPAFKIHNLRLLTTPYNTPNDLFVALVDFLMLSPCGYQSIVSRLELLLLFAAIAYDRPVAREGKHNGVLFAMMVDSRSGMWLGDHARCTNTISKIDECILANPVKIIGQSLRNLGFRECCNRQTYMPSVWPPD